MSMLDTFPLSFNLKGASQKSGTFEAQKNVPVGICRRSSGPRERSTGPRDHAVQAFLWERFNLNVPWERSTFATVRSWFTHWVIVYTDIKLHVHRPVTFSRVVSFFLQIPVWCLILTTKVCFLFCYSVYVKVKICCFQPRISCLR